MKSTTKKPAEALDLLPEELREPAVAFLLEQAEKFRVLKKDLDKGLADIEAGHVRERDFADFLRRAELSEPKS
jgi:hypothetical protein